MATHCPVCKVVTPITVGADGSETCPRCGRSLSETPSAIGVVESLSTSVHSPGSANTSSLGLPSPSSDGNPHAAGDTLLGRYTLVKELGRGTFGEVWLAQDLQLARQVAIKIPRHQGKHIAQREAFLHEARIAAQLKHPGIVGIFDVQQLPAGQAFVVMEYVAGRTLAAALQESRVSPREAANFVAQIADALHAAHRQSLVHRDLKPANILLDPDGLVHIADFGLAITDDLQRSMAGDIAGTFTYMSPEQVRGEAHRLDGRTDIWSLGVIFYELLTGKRPFGGNREQLCDEIQHREPRPPRQIDERIPAELERICLKCLAKQPTERYATAADLAAELRVSRPRTSLRNKWWFAGAGAVAVGGVALAIYLVNQSNPAVINVPLNGSATLTTPLTPGSGGPVPSLELPAELAVLNGRLQAARKSKNEREEFSILIDVVNELRDRGHHVMAEQASQRLVELAGADPGMRPLALSEWGVALIRLGQPERAIAPLLEAATAFDVLYQSSKRLPESPERDEMMPHMARMVGLSQTRLGNAYKEFGQKELARKAYEQADAILSAHGRKSELVTLLLNFGAWESTIGNDDAAQRLLNRGIVLARELGDAEGEGSLLLSLANSQSRRGDESGANDVYQQVYDRLTPQSSYELRSKLLISWSQTLAELDHKPEARTRLEELRAIARPSDDLAQQTLRVLSARLEEKK